MAVDVRTITLRIVDADGETLSDLESLQGMWTEKQYLRLTDSIHKLIEFTDGSLEVLPMPTRRHQVILRYLLFTLVPFIQNLGGDALFAPLRLRVREGKFREPDLLAILDIDDPRGQDAYWLGADLVMEVVSADNPERDTVEKVIDYAEAGIPEYWIVNPLDETITALRLEGEKYVEHGVFRRGDMATSVLLEGFSVQVDAVFDVR